MKRTRQLKRTYHWLPLAALALLLSLLIGCGDDNDDAGSVTLLLDHTVAGQALALDDTDYTNEAGNNYQITKLEYILTTITLLQADGKRFELATQHFRDARSTSTQLIHADKVPGGTYTALSFTFGIAAADNLTGALPNIAAFNNMAWPDAMGGGYHYMKLEGNYQAADTTGAFLVHLGPSSGGDFSIAIELPLTLEINGDDWDIHLSMDINEWFTNPTTYDFVGRGGIMGDVVIQEALRQNGGTIFSLGPITHSDSDHDHDDY